MKRQSLAGITYHHFCTTLLGVIQVHAQCKTCLISWTTFLDQNSSLQTGHSVFPSTSQGRMHSYRNTWWQLLFILDQATSSPTWNDSMHILHTSVLFVLDPSSASTSSSILLYLSILWFVLPNLVEAQCTQRLCCWDLYLSKICSADSAAGVIASFCSFL